MITFRFLISHRTFLLLCRRSPCLGSRLRIGSSFFGSIFFSSVLFLFLFSLNPLLECILKKNRYT
jgi:hypothetical protein